MVIKCKKCNKSPNEIKSVVMGATLEMKDPEEYVKENEGTYNEQTGEFYCDDCYIKVGMPLGKA